MECAQHYGATREPRADRKRTSHRPPSRTGQPSVVRILCRLLGLWKFISFHKPHWRPTPASFIVRSPVRPFFGALVDLVSNPLAFFDSESKWCVDVLCNDVTQASCGCVLS